MSIQFGCISCKKTKRNEKIVHVAQQTMEEILQQTFHYLKNRAATQGVEVPDEFRDKIFKWARKNELINDAEVIEEPVAEPVEKKVKIAQDQ